MALHAPEMLDGACGRVSLHEGNCGDHTAGGLYDLPADPTERNNLAGNRETAQIESELKDKLNKRLKDTQDPILDGVVPAPPGYMEHYLAAPDGPGGLPQMPGREEWLTLRWPSGATEHRFGRRT